MPLNQGSLKMPTHFEWRKKNEKNAAIHFMKIKEKNHTNPKLQTSGLYLLTLPLEQLPKTF